MSLINTNLGRFAIVTAIVCIGSVSMGNLGYYRGLNVLAVISFLCLVVSWSERSAFLFCLALAIAGAYVLLSSVTIGYGHSSIQ
jgi:hypothetical protein